MIKKLEISCILVCVIAVFWGMAILGFDPNMAKAYNGVAALTEKELYDETNTYNVNSSCFDKNTGEFITTWIDIKKTNKTQYKISYDMSVRQNRSVMNKAQITVLTPGLASNAGTWSNNFSSTKTSDI